MGTLFFVMSGGYGSSTPSYGGYGSYGSPDSQRKEVLQQIRQQANQQIGQALVTIASDMCFDMCMGKPAPVILPTEQNCVQQCAGRFVEASKLVSNSYQQYTQSMAVQMGTK